MVEIILHLICIDINEITVNVVGKPHLDSNLPDYVPCIVAWDPQSWVNATAKLEIVRGQELKSKFKMKQY